MTAAAGQWTRRRRRRRRCVGASESEKTSAPISRQVNGAPTARARFVAGSELNQLEQRLPQTVDTSEKRETSINQTVGRLSNDVPTHRKVCFLRRRRFFEREQNRTGRLMTSTRRQLSFPRPARALFDLFNRLAKCGQKIAADEIHYNTTDRRRRREQRAEQA